MPPDPKDSLPPEPILRVRGLRVSLGQGRARREIVRGVDFELAPGESLGLVGESGSGKSTIARAILGLVPADGSIRVDGVEVVGATKAAMLTVRRRAQMVFQDPVGSLNPRMRAWAIVSEPLLVHGVARAAHDRRARAAEMLARCGLGPDALDRFPHEFSGGQRQRIAIARALVLAPGLVICDEPTSALDASIQAQVINLLSDLRSALGIAYLFISHDLAVVAHLCTRIAVMHEGRIVESGPRDAITGAPEHEYTRSLLASARG